MKTTYNRWFASRPLARRELCKQQDGGDCRVKIFTSKHKRKGGQFFVGTRLEFNRESRDTHNK